MKDRCRRDSPKLPGVEREAFSGTLEIRPRGAGPGSSGTKATRRFAARSGLVVGLALLTACVGTTGGGTGRPSSGQGPGDSSARATFQTATRLEAEGELVQAVAAYRKCVDLVPERLGYHVAYQDAALRLPATGKTPQPATQAMREYYKRLPDAGRSPQTPYLRARLQRHDRREEPARLLLESALQRDEGFYPAQYELGLLWRGVDRPSLAHQWFKRAAANSRAQPVARRAWAEVSMELGLWNEAVDAYARYTAEVPADLESQRAYLRLVLYKVSDKLAVAERVVANLLRALPDDIGLKMDRAAVAWRKGEIEAAVDGYRGVLRADPKRARAALNLGNLFYDTGRRQKPGSARRASLERARRAYIYYRTLGIPDDAFDWFDQKIAVRVNLATIAKELGPWRGKPPTSSDI